MVNNRCRILAPSLPSQVLEYSMLQYNIFLQRQFLHYFTIYRHMYEYEKGCCYYSEVPKQL